MVVLVKKDLLVILLAIAGMEPQGLIVSWILTNVTLILVETLVFVISLRLENGIVNVTKVIWELIARFRKILVCR